MTSRRPSCWSLLAAAGLLLPVGTAPRALHAQGDLNALINETQQQSSQPKVLRLVWWIPQEFWRMSMASEADITPEQSDSLLRILGRHTIVAVVSGQVQQFGSVRYDSDADIRANTRFIDAQGVAYAPVAESEISDDEQMVISVFRPIFSNMLGQMGQNLDLLLFPVNDAQGHPLADPLHTGRFTINVFDEKFAWRLPLGSLLSQKRCPVDGELMSGAWTFCPIHGVKLEELQH
jgi:hypothetical protein